MNFSVHLFKIVTTFLLINNLRWVYGSDSSTVLVPVVLISEDQENQLDNHTTQLSIPVHVNNGTVIVARQEIEPDEPININILVPLQLYSPEGKVLSSTVVSTEAKVVVLESRVDGNHVLRLQILVSSVDSRDVVPLTIPEIRLFLNDDGSEKSRTFQLLKSQHSYLINPEENDISMDDSISSYSTTTTEDSKHPDTKTINSKTKENHLSNQNYIEIDERSIFCRGCPITGCVRPEPFLCVQLPPAMRLAVCAILFCLAAFLLMLFVHVFILRPSHSSLFSTSRYARNLRMAWAYAPLMSDREIKEPCA